jgi:Zn-dependent peptidase ImmA (M78 family)
MTPSQSYEAASAMAYQKRELYQVTTDTLNLNVIRKIYREEGVRIDPWDFDRTIRAVYMCDDDDPSVALNKSLPREPKLFSLVHELKHHYMDRDVILQGSLRCGDYNANELIEKSAEVFAAEFIFPEGEFLAKLELLGILKGGCSVEDVVRLKRSTSACVSYQFLQKRLVRLGFAPADRLKKVQFTKLEERLYGVPIYKQKWFKDRRASAKISSR